MYSVPQLHTNKRRQIKGRDINKTVYQSVVVIILPFVRLKSVYKTRGNCTMETVGNNDVDSGRLFTV